jgi:hypothetical protein
MPNWCTNVATINHGDSALIDSIETELKKEKPELFQMLRPRPPEFEEQWYSWNVDNWGTKWEANIYNYERIDENNIKISFDTAWGPCVSLYEYLFENGYDTTAYYEEGGMAFCGKYEFGEDYFYDYSDMNSETMKEELPSDLDEMFGLSERMADQEAEDEDEEDDEEDTEPNWELEYGFTDWFPKKIKPVRTGIYEVSTDSWPFPQKCEWDGKKWNHLGGAKITQWRGLAVDPESKFNTLFNTVDLEKALEGLKEEFDKLRQTNYTL